MNPWRTLLGIVFLACVFSGSAQAADASNAPMELKMEFQKGFPCAVRVLHDGSVEGPWLLEFMPSAGPKSTLRLPLQYTGDMQVEELRAVSFISPDKQELFISFTAVRNGIFAWAYVVDFANGAAGILFDGDWLTPGFSAEGAFADFYRIEIIFPELFDRYMLFIQDEKDADYDWLYDAKGMLREAREIAGSYPTSFKVVGPDEHALFALETVVAVAGASDIDLLGEYAFSLRRQADKWQLHGDAQLTSVPGINFNRFQGAVPVADLRASVTAKGLEKSLSLPLAHVKKIKDKKELNALAARFGVKLAGKFDEQAADAWFFLPGLAPLTFNIYKVQTLAGESEVTDLIESYVVQEGQSFVYSGDQMAWDKDTESMCPQFVIAVSHEPGNEQYILWEIPENENDPLSPGFAPLQD